MAWQIVMTGQSQQCTSDTTTPMRCWINQIYRKINSISRSNSTIAGALHCCVHPWARRSPPSGAEVNKNPVLVRFVCVSSTAAVNMHKFFAPLSLSAFCSKFLTTPAATKGCCRSSAESISAAYKYITMGQDFSALSASEGENIIRMSLCGPYYLISARLMRMDHNGHLCIHEQSQQRCTTNDFILLSIHSQRASRRMLLRWTMWKDLEISVGKHNEDEIRSPDEKIKLCKSWLNFKFI